MTKGFEYDFSFSDWRDYKLLDIVDRNDGLGSMIVVGIDRGKALVPGSDPPRHAPFVRYYCKKMEVIK